MIKIENNQSIEVAIPESGVHLDLVITDRETVIELFKHEEESARNEFVRSALKVGVLAIRQACGVVDAQSIQMECQKFMDVVEESLTGHAEKMSGQVEKLLGKYFDPSSGEFNQRLDRLVKKDGELEVLLGKHLNGDGSSLTTTLEKHIGQNSPLLQMLSPDQKKGILAAIDESLGLMLKEQNKSIVSQFSLDDKESALSRLVGEITEKNGGLRVDLANDLEKIAKEFSLDNDEGALTRLVNRVEKANCTILEEFSTENEHSALNKMASLLELTNKNIGDSLSLDKENSPLSRLRREILDVTEGMSKANNAFQEQVNLSLETLKTRKLEAARSTVHGIDFQNEFKQVLQQLVQRSSDILDFVGDTPGKISRCKVGDLLMALNPDSAAPNARIVFEAKEDKSYTMKKALEEINIARDNREAQVGVFVFSQASAPEGLESLCRYGRDLLVVWDACDPNTDIILKAAISVARMIAIEERRANEQTHSDLTELTFAIDSLCREVSILDEIIKSAKAARNHCDKIFKKGTSFKKKIDSRLKSMNHNAIGLSGLVSVKTITTNI